MLELVLLPILLVADAESPVATESTLQATERILEREQDLVRRIPLLLRWMSLQYEVKKDKKEEADQIVISRFQNEIASLEKRAQGDELDPLLRQLAWRQAGAKKWSDAAASFQRMKRRLPKDDLVFGDSLLASGLSTLALEAFSRAKDGLPALASYKTAWAYLQLNDASKALKEFDEALKRAPEQEGDVRAQAFRERAIPYVERYDKPSFTGVEAGEWRALAETVFGSDPGKVSVEFQSALKALVEGFIGKGNTLLARQVYDQLLAISPDQQDFFLQTAPSWLRIYRTKLEHDQVERIVSGLPQEALSPEKHAALLSELQQTSNFYETLVGSENKAEMKRYLNLVYAKTMILFPGAQQLASQRINAAKLAWDSGDYEKCLQFLEGLKREDLTSDVGSRLEAQCRLKRLDEWRAQKNGGVAAEIKVALVEKKFYQAFPESQRKGLFEGLGRILVAEVSNNPESEVLRSTLNEVIANYPFEKDSALFKQMRGLEAQLKFKSLATKEGGQSGDDFYALFLESEPYSETGQKALGNSIILASAQTIHERCGKLIEIQGAKLNAQDALWERCLRAAEESFDLERMYSYFSAVEKSLTDDQRIRFSLVELALGKPTGQERLLKVKSPRAKQALLSWNGPQALSHQVSAGYEKLSQKIERFRSSLKPVKPSEIEKTIPIRVKAWEALDAELFQFAKSHDGDDASDAFYRRAELADRMFNWIKKMPKPVFKSKADAKNYDAQMESVVQIWAQQVEDREEECSQKAPFLSRTFVAENQSLCPEQLSEADVNVALQDWKEKQKAMSSSTLQSDPRRAEALKMVEFARQQKSDLQARYWLLNSLDYLKAPEDRAMSLEQLFERTKNSVYLDLALAANPFSVSALESFKRVSKLNGVHTRIIEAKIHWLKDQANSQTPTLASTPAVSN